MKNLIKSRLIRFLPKKSLPIGSVLGHSKKSWFYFSIFLSIYRLELADLNSVEGEQKGQPVSFASPLKLTEWRHLFGLLLYRGKQSLFLSHEAVKEILKMLDDHYLAYRFFVDAIISSVEVKMCGGRSFLPAKKTRVIDVACGAKSQPMTWAWRFFFVQPAATEEKNSKF